MGQKLGVKQDPTTISSKYRDLHSIFMTKLKMEERSGSGSVNWKYMKIFEQYLGKDIEQDPPGKLESEGGLLYELINLIDDGDEGVNMEQDNCVLPKKAKPVNQLVMRKKLMKSSSIVCRKWVMP